MLYNLTMERQYWTVRLILTGVFTLLLASGIVYGESNINNSPFFAPFNPQDIKKDSGDNDSSGGGDDATSELVSGGSITGNEIVCDGAVPQPVLNEFAPSGGEGLLMIRWEKRIDDGPWVVIPDETSLNYYPGPLVGHTYFRRSSRRSAHQPWKYSNIVVKQLTEGITDLKVTTEDITCKGGSDGSAKVSVIGGTPGFIYEWSTDQNTNEITGLEAGVYSITVTDINGCTLTEANVTVEEPEFSVEAQLAYSWDASCPGKSDGAIFVEAINGVEPFTFEWSNDVIGPVNYNVTAGSYNVKVTDGLGCEHELNGLSIAEPNDFELVESTEATTCHGFSDGTVELNGLGGTPPYLYYWHDNGSISPSRSGMSAGTKSVTVYDDNGCTFHEEVVIAEPKEIEVKPFTINNNLCKASINVVPSGGTAPYSYEWESGETTGFLNELCPGDYVVTVTDAQGCKKTETLSIDADFTKSKVEIKMIINPIVEESTLLIKFPYGEDVDLRIYNTSGQLVEEITDGELITETEMIVRLNREKYANGLYLVKVNTPHYSATEKVLVANH